MWWIITLIKRYTDTSTEHLSEPISKNVFFVKQCSGEY